MSGFQIVIIGIVILAALGFWNYQRTSNQKSQLQQAGFEISERIGGSPELVLDTKRRELALVNPDSVDRYGFNDVVGATIEYDQHEHDSQYHFRIEFVFTQQRKGKVNFGSEAEARAALQRLEQLLKAQ